MSRPATLPDVFEAIAHETRVLSPFRYRHARLGTRSVPRRLPPAAAWQVLAGALAELIYAYYYLADPRALATLRSATNEPAPMPARADFGFVRQLRAANAGTGYFDPGWTIAEAPAGPIGPFTVRKGLLSLSVRADQVRPVADGRVGIGERVAVRFPKDRSSGLAGFYKAIGSAGPPPSGEPIVRWYFHVLPAAATRLMGLLTSELNRLAVPFVFKVLNHPDEYTRPDAGVLYLPRAAFVTTRRTVLEAHRAVEAATAPRVPAFTRPVRPGLGLAEEPPPAGRPISFGQHRSRLIAQGLIEAATHGRTSAAGRLESVLAAFSAAGFSIATPHLNPGSPEFDVDPA